MAGSKALIFILPVSLRNWLRPAWWPQNMIGTHRQICTIYRNQADIFLPLWHIQWNTLSFCNCQVNSGRCLSSSCHDLLPQVCPVWSPQEPSLWYWAVHSQAQGIPWMWYLPPYIDFCTFLKNFHRNRYENLSGPLPGFAEQEASAGKYLPVSIASCHCQISSQIYARASGIFLYKVILKASTIIL